MNEGKKPGFFSRLFGRKDKGAPEAEPPQSKVAAPEIVVPDDAQPAVLPAAAKPKKPNVKKPAAKKPAAKASKPVAPKEPATILDQKAPAAKKPTPKPKSKKTPLPKPAAKSKKSPAPVKASEPSVEEPILEGEAESEEALADLRAMDPGPVESSVEWLDTHPGGLDTPIEPVAAPARKGWFQRLTGGLKRSSDQLSAGLNAVFLKRKLDDHTLEELEDVLLTADLGLETSEAIIESLRRDKFDREVSAEEVRAVLAEEVSKVLAPVAVPLLIDGTKKPFVILMVGVNGSGKTTTIGKLAQRLKAEGRDVLLAAGDTFRAAAIEQLQIWGERSGVPVVTRPTGSDASGLAFDALKQAQDEGSDVLIIDTAGRLQNRDELMAELEKIIRVIQKLDAEAPHAVLLTLDATTGQNALTQAEIFQKRAGVTGLVMTKLDGTARGGILVAIARRFGLPVHFIGVGEGIEDFEAFSARDFAAAIAGGDTDPFSDDART